MLKQFFDFSKKIPFLCFSIALLTAFPGCTWDATPGYVDAAQTSTVSPGINVTSCYSSGGNWTVAAWVDNFTNAPYYSIYFQGAWTRAKPFSTDIDRPTSITDIALCYDNHNEQIFAIWTDNLDTTWYTVLPDEDNPQSASWAPAQNSGLSNVKAPSCSADLYGNLFITYLDTQTYAALSFGLSNYSSGHYQNTATATIASNLNSSRWYVRSCYDSINDCFFASWTDNNNYAYATQGSYPNSWNTPVALYGSSTPSACSDVTLCYNSTDDIMLAVYANIDAGSIITCNYIHGLDSQWSEPITINGNALNNVNACYDSVHNQFVLTWIDAISNFPMFCFITWNGSSLGLPQPGVIQNISTSFQDCSCSFDSNYNRITALWPESISKNPQSTMCYWDTVQAMLALGQTNPFTTVVGSPITIYLEGIDAYSSTLTFSIISHELAGTLSDTISDGHFSTINYAHVTYTPPHYATSDTLSFYVTNTSYQRSELYTVTINVYESVEATGTTQNISHFEANKIILNATSPLGNPLTFKLVRAPRKGALDTIIPIITSGSNQTASINYVPAREATGTDSFSFKVYNEIADIYSTPTTVTLNITPNNPIAKSQSVSPAGEPIIITLTAADAQGSYLQFNIVEKPSSGALSEITQPRTAGVVQSAKVTYTPYDDASGDDLFTFKVFNGSSYSNTITVTINNL